MPLGPGAKLGPYEVLAPLGAGGMGEVYRARDTRLDRTVALKVLPGHLAADPDLRQRFEREARAVSSLNHPHICALFDVGQQDGTDYLVMEYLEGETLADRLGRGPLPTDQVLRYGVEIADALDKAHRQGIVHRDLKPGNVMLTRSGAKLLDFGLAKLQTAATPAASVLSAVATAHRPLTEAGTVLGTFQYMAPEQLEGKEADARTDLFALGTILYEMATGRKAFSGKSQASLIAAILSADPPPLSSIQPLAPPALERLVKVCLAKDPDDRLQTAHDVMQELKWIAEAGSAAGVPAPVAARRRSRERLAWILVGLLPLLASALTVFVISRQRPALESTRFEVPAPAGATSVGYQLLSPDGRKLAFIATVDGVTSIWVRPLDSLEAQLLRGTEVVEGDYIWSSDSASLAFVARNRLLRLALSGGPPFAVCETNGDLETGEWGPDGTILLSSSREGVIYRVPASGGTPSPVTTKKAGEAHLYPSFLPDGRYFLYLARRSPIDKSAIYLGSLDAPERPRLLLNAESQPYYSPSGHILFVREGTLMAQPFDAGALRVHGEVVSLADDVRYWGPNPYADFSVSANGTLAFRRQARLRTQLTWLDSTGRAQGTIGLPGPYSQPALSPDGTRLVVVGEEALRSNRIWLFDLERGSSRPLTEPGLYGSPLWSRDGRSILFGTGYRGDSGELRRRAWDGTGSEEVLLTAEGLVRPGDVSPDGRVVAYMTTDPLRGPDILVLPLAGDKRASALVQTVKGEGLPQFSPDGRWIAYTSFEGATFEAFVEAYPPAGGRYQVSVAGGTHARWRPDGREIFYLSPDGTLMAVDVAPSPSGFRAGQARALFKAPIDTRGFPLATNHYVVAANGQRFLFASPLTGGAPTPVTVVLHWAAERQP